MAMTEEPVNESEGALADLLQVSKTDGGDVVAEDESPQRKQLAADETVPSTSVGAEN